MAKTNTQGKTTSSQDDVLKNRKKQAKKEAKLMLKVEQAKKDVQRAEQKIHKAQDNLKTYADRLHDLEGILSQLQKPAAQTTDKASKAKKTDNTGKSNKVDRKKQAKQAFVYVGQELDPGETYQDTEAVEELHLSSPEPVEGGIELTEGTATDKSQPASNQSTSHPGYKTFTGGPSAEDVIIQSGEGSIPIETSDEHAWPPPAVREELAEAITEEVKHEQATATDQPTAATSHEGTDEGEDASSDRSDTSSARRTSRKRRTHTSTASSQSGEENQEHQEDNQTSHEGKTSK